MNASKIRSEIEKVIAENRNHMHPKQARRQYAPGKAQLAKLTELGILDYMPEGFGFSDADAVIRAATAEKSAIMNAYGEGEEITASALNEALNEAEEVTIEFFDKPLNTSLHAPVLTAKVQNGIAVDEFTWQPLGDYRTPGAVWGLLGKTAEQLRADGFTKRPERTEEVEYYVEY